MESNPTYHLETLSNKETQLLKALAKGTSRKEVAEELHISITTYDGYRKSIRQKLRIKNQMDWSRVLIEIEKKTDSL